MIAFKKAHLDDLDILTHLYSPKTDIQVGNPNIAYVKKEDITWDVFFKTLPFKLTKNCLTTGTKQTFRSGPSGSLKFYINDKEDIDALDKKIKDGDQLLVTFGNEDESQIQNQIQQIPNLK